MNAVRGKSKLFMHEKCSKKRSRPVLRKRLGFPYKNGSQQNTRDSFSPSHLPASHPPTTDCLGGAKLQRRRKWMVIIAAAQWQRWASAYVQRIRDDVRKRGNARIQEDRWSSGSGRLRARARTSRSEYARVHLSFLFPLTPCARYLNPDTIHSPIFACSGYGCTEF